MSGSLSGEGSGARFTPEVVRAYELSVASDGWTSRHPGRKTEVLSKPGRSAYIPGQGNADIITFARKDVAQAISTKEGLLCSFRSGGIACVGPFCHRGSRS